MDGTNSMPISIQNRYLTLKLYAKNWHAAKTLNASETFIPIPVLPTSNHNIALISLLPVLRCEPEVLDGALTLLSMASHCA